MPDSPQTQPDEAVPVHATAENTTSDDTTSVDTTSDDTTSDDTEAAGAPDEVKNSFREALARKAGRNSHVESHLEGRHIGGGNNDTHKRQFRRKSG